MSLRINKDNIFFILTEDRYSVAKPIDMHMSKDFSLYVKAKVNEEFLEIGKEHFLFCRNGKHSGIAIYKSEDNKIHVVFQWWIKNKETNLYEVKRVGKWIPDEIADKFNEYVMICDDEEKNIKCFFNNNLVGKIEYKDSTRKTYKESFYWFGCGSMLNSQTEHMYIGDFDYELAFLLNKKLEISEINEISENFDTYSFEMYNGLRRLKDNFYLYNNLDNQRILKDNFAFFCDFNHSTRYKIWDMTFSGNYPQVYIEDNIYY
ncbi:MAG: hypothetical protein FJ375_00835 [Pelagibacterales bacterium]|nr:hypothetical protein [Pelagibacterales bacterium]